MFKKTLSTALLVMCYELLVMSCFAQEEKLTITTYYPSPYGSYREIRAQRMAIGDNYSSGSQYCWEGTCTNTIDANADLVVEGNVGIGTASPQGLLDVNSGSSSSSALFVRAHNVTADQGGIIHHQGSTYAWQEVAQETGDLNNGHLTFNYVEKGHPEIQRKSNVLTLRATGNVGIGTVNAVSDLTFGRNRDSTISTDTSDGSDNKGLVLGGGGTGGSTRGGAVAVYGNEYLGHEGVVLLQAGAAPARGEIMLTTTGGQVTVSYSGNVGIGTATPTSVASPGNNQATGNLDVNDVYLRSISRWASQFRNTARPVYQCPNRGRSDCGGCPARDISFSSTCSYWNDSGCNSTLTATCILVGYLVAP